MKFFKDPRNFPACSGLKNIVICLCFSCSFSVENFDLKFLIRRNFPPEFIILSYLQKFLRQGASFFIIRNFLPEFAQLFYPQKFLRRWIYDFLVQKILQHNFQQKFLAYYFYYEFNSEISTSNIHIVKQKNHKAVPLDTTSPSKFRKIKGVRLGDGGGGNKYLSLVMMILSYLFVFD